MFDPKFLKVIKEAFELLTEKLSPAQMNDRMISFAVKGILDKISEREITDKMLSFIPGSSHETLNDIVYMLINSKKKESILDILNKERSPELRLRLLTALMRTKDIEIIKKLFENTPRRSIFQNRPLMDLVTLCGTFKVEASMGHLKKVLEDRCLFRTKARSELRVQAVLSMARIGTPDAIEFVRAFANDPDKSVGAVCRLVLGSDNAQDGNAV